MAGSPCLQLPHLAQGHSFFSHPNIYLSLTGLGHARLLPESLAWWLVLGCHHEANCQKLTGKPMVLDTELVLQWLKTPAFS